MHFLNNTGKARHNVACVFNRIDQLTISGDCLVNGARTGFRRFDTVSCGDVILNIHPALKIVIGPAIGFALVFGIQCHCKGMGLVDRHVTALVVFLAVKADLVLHVTQAVEHDPNLDLIGTEGLAVQGGPDPEFRRHAIFKNGQLNGKAVLSQHAAIVRPLFHFFISRRLLVFDGIGWR